MTGKSVLGKRCGVAPEEVLIKPVSIDPGTAKQGNRGRYRLEVLSAREAKKIDQNIDQIKNLG